MDFDLEMLKYSLNLKKYNPNQKHFSHKPHASLSLMGVHVQTDQDGFRHHTQKGNNHSAKGHIMFLGDSLTFGWGVPHSLTFAGRSADWLSGKSHIINAGHCNTNTEQQIKILESWLAGHSLQQLFLFYFINDIEPTPLKLGPTFWDYSFFLSLLRSKTKRLLTQENFKSYYSRLYSQDHLNNLEGHFKKLKSLSETHHFRIKVFLLPDLHDLKNQPFQREHQLVQNILKDLDIENRDLTPVFRHIEDSRALWVAPNDAHPNAEGHEIIFNSIKKHLPSESETLH
jgi:lysophospholipase L1-like esterase